MTGKFRAHFSKSYKKTFFAKKIAFKNLFGAIFFAFFVFFLTPQVVGGHAVVVAHAADEGKPRFARAVFIVAPQRLTDAEVGRCLALADILLPAQRRESLGKGSVHCFSLLSL